MIKKDTLDLLVAKLSRTIHRGRYRMGGGTVTTDGSGKTISSFWGGERIMELANPDGPEAADAITALQERVVELQQALAGVLETSGARGTYHALKYADAVEAAEAALTKGAAQ